MSSVACAEYLREKEKKRHKRKKYMQEINQKFKLFLFLKK